MLNNWDITTPVAAFIAGLLTSIHCVGMCGPLSCALFAKCGKHATSQTLTYQISRVAGYSILGGVAGAAGAPIAGLFNNQAAQLFPWLLAAFFIALMFNWEGRLPQPRFLAPLLRRAGSLPPAAQATCLGAFTPLLPCGPLYLLLGVALASGSFSRGLLLLAAFALGTVPLYLFGQMQFFRLQRRFTPTVVRRMRQSFAAVSALVLIWRAVVNSGLGLACTHCH